MSTALDHRMPALGFDTESTGTDPLQARIVTIALVTIPHHGRPAPAHWLLDPGVPIPDEAAAVHGITTEHAQQHGQAPADVLPQVADRIAKSLARGVPVVAFNAAYDFTLLEAELTRHGIPTLTDRLGPGRIAPVLDPMVMDRHADQYRKRICPCGCGATDRTLVGCCLHYGVIHTGAHDAGADALAACRLVDAIRNRHHAKFASMPLAMLHANQATWRRRQMDGLREWFDKQGTEHDGCCGAWPIHGT